MCASSNGSTELVSNLLLNGASPKTKDKWGCRPLHCAVPAGNLGAVRLLLKAGASPNSRRRVGKGKENTDGTAFTEIS